MIRICLGQLYLRNGAESPNDKLDCYLFWSVFYRYVSVSVCVRWDNGIIEVLGVTGALMPGLLERG